MSDYLSGRELELNIGISSYTESKTVLNVIGRSVLGVTSTTDLTTDTLKVKGDFSFTNFTTSGLVISGVITSGRFISTVTTGTSPISVASSTLVQNLNAEYLNGYPSNYYTNASNLSSGFIPASRLNTANNFNVLGDLYVSNNLSVGGTSVVLNAQSLQIKDKDITLGITTDAFGNDISTDLTANHGGIAIASTVGSPLFSFSIAGINSLPDTYKQLMWIKSGTFAGLNTDAFLFNYGVGIGTNQIQSGVRLAVGALNVTNTEVKSSNFVGTLYGNLIGTSTYASLAGISTYSTLSGVSTNVIGGISSVTSLNVTGPSTLGSVNISGGIVTATSFFGNLVGTATTSNNISGGQRGSLHYQDSPGITTLLTAGSTNFILLSGGPGAAPYWGPASSASQAFTGITVRDEGTTVGIQSSITILDIVGPNVVATASSGIATITVADYVSKSGYSTNSGIATYSTLSGVSTNVIGGISSVTSLNVTGPSTLGSVNISGGIVTATSFFGNLVGTATTSNNLSAGSQGSVPFQKSAGITSFLTPGTVGHVLLTNGSGQDPYWGPVSAATGNFGGVTILDEGNVQGTASSIGRINFVGPNISVIANIGSNGIATVTVTDYVSISGYSTASGISTYATSSGIATYATSSGIATYSTSAGIATYSTSAGIATYATSSGIATYSTSAGIATYATISGIATNVIGGISSVTSLTVSGIGTTIPVKIGTGSSIIVIDSLGELGIGTANPQFPLDVRGNARFTGTVYASNVISSDANLSEIVRSNVGIVSTNSLNTIVLDTYNAAVYRSAKYTIQVSSQGSLILGSSSISSITGGSNYFPGTYSNQDVISQSGLGSYGKATLTVVPEYSLVVNSCIDGVFTSSSNLPTGIATNTTIFFNQNLNLSQRQQSQISSFTLTTPGVGYTGVPTLTVSPPIISGNTVPEVGIGSTATLIVNSMRVSNAVQTSSGYVTTTIPTITFSGPSTGVTATGQVSFGISTLSITRPGSGYTSSPSFAITSPYSPTGFAATVGLGISSLNLIVSGGIGYLNLESPTITINPIGGIGTGGVISGVGVGGTIAFTLVNSGFGYTAPPLVSVSGGTGIGAGVTISTMFVSNIDVTNPGAGVTVGLARTTDITFFGGGGTGAGATVSTIVSTGVSITNSGYGYTSTTIPTITYSPVNATTAQVGLAISSIQQLSTGIGYTVIPSVTVTPGPSVGTTVNAGFSTTLGYAGFANTTILPGPIYGGATVYYIIPISSNTFAISNTIGIGLTPNATRVGYGFSVGLSTAKTGTLAIGSTTIIAGGINTNGITVGTPVQNSTLITPGTIVSDIGSGTITLNAPALNTGSISTSFNFGNFISAGGKVNTISFTDIGSGYVANQSITTRLSNFDRISPVYDSNVGTGFTFTVSNIVNNFQISDILTLHSVGSATTNAFAIEEGGISDVSELGEFSASLTGTGSTIFNLNFTPIYAYNTLKFNKTLFTI